MKKLLCAAILAIVAAVPATAQITINASHMPVAGDTLRYSVADPTVSINYATTGANTTWNFNTLVPIAQGIDAYKFAAQVNATYAGTIAPTAYGYKVADSLPGAPLPVQDIYNFFNKKPVGTPTRFVIEGFAALVGGTPIPINYSDEDEVYFFPLTYPHTQDNSTFKLEYQSILGSFSRQGTRKTDVDGYGTISTPYTTSPVSVIRVRSEIAEVDSFTFGGQNQGIPRTSVEYKWLSTTEHYPLLIVTTNMQGGNETVTDVRYRDTKRAGVGVASLQAGYTVLQTVPNPAQNSTTLQVPSAWKIYTVNIYDAAGKIVATTRNTPNVNTTMLAAGTYIIAVESSDGVTGFARLVK